MVSVQSPPGGREVPYARALLLPAIAMAAATGAAVALMTGPARTAVGWCGAIATVLVTATAAEVVRRGRAVRAARAELAHRTKVMERRVSLHDAEIDHLREELLPAVLGQVRAGSSPEDAVRVMVDSDPAQRNIPKSQRALLVELVRIVDHEELQREAAQRSFVSIARRVQAIVHQQNVELREMEEDHGRNPEVFDDLLRIDHGTALIGRLADSIAVLGGGRPGRQWPKPVPLYSVLRGAMSRILEYRRIELHSIAKIAVNGIHVEPVIHAAAELLDNATRYSPPHTKVHVTAVEVQTGVAIEIEDAGVSLSEEARTRAESDARAGGARPGPQQSRRGPPARPRRRRPPHGHVQDAGLPAAVRIRRRARRTRRAAQAAHRGARQRSRPRHRCRRRAQGRLRRCQGPRAHGQEAPPHHRTPVPERERHGGRRPRGHRVDGERPAAAP